MNNIHHWIDGKVVESTSGRTGPVFNPATGEQSGVVGLASVEEVDAAVAAAHAAFPAWRSASLSKRSEVMFRIRELVDANRWFVMAVAHALEQFKTITGEDIDAIYHGRVGPTVDGRAYRSEHYRLAFGRFHAAARRAHDDQSPLEEPFPELEEARVKASTALPLPPPVPVAAITT